MDQEYQDWQDGDLKVVINLEEQYSIWPSDRKPPPGWKEVGVFGNRNECLEYIRTTWTDMRPLSLRKHMEESVKMGPELDAKEQRRREMEAAARDPRDELVDFLSNGTHRVELVLRPERTIDELKACIERKYIHIRFTETRGGTELGVRLSPEFCDLGRLGDLAVRSDALHLEGTLVLNSMPVICTADIDIATFEGTGHLKVSPEGATSKAQR